MCMGVVCTCGGLKLMLSVFLNSFLLHILRQDIMWTQFDSFSCRPSQFDPGIFFLHFLCTWIAGRIPYLLNIPMGI